MRNIISEDPKKNKHKIIDDTFSILFIEKSSFVSKIINKHKKRYADSPENDFSRGEDFRQRSAVSQDTAL